VRASDARRWGWHRLDRSWAARIVAAAGVERGDLVLDVGAGDGALSSKLVQAGARVLAVELHPERARALRDRFAGQSVRVLEVDAVDLRLPIRGFRVVANPPFGIVVGLLRRLVAPGSRLLSADVVLPRHVAQRWCSPAAPGKGRWGALFETELGMRVPASAFRPPAPRDAVVLHIRRVDSRRVRQTTGVDGHPRR
jgi:23S rRNA (adenine-N6)-dimethyltransferase